MIKEIKYFLAILGIMMLTFGYWVYDKPYNIKNAKTEIINQKEVYTAGDQLTVMWTFEISPDQCNFIQVTDTFINTRTGDNKAYKHIWNGNILESVHDKYTVDEMGKVHTSIKTFVIPETWNDGTWIGQRAVTFEECHLNPVNHTSTFEWPAWQFKIVQ